MRIVLLMLFMTGCVTLMGQNSKETIEIHDAAELRAIVNDLNGSYRLVADIDLGGKVDEGETYTTWMPLGNNPTSESDEGSFNGILDGNGNKITNLRVDVMDATTTYIGLFGRIGESGVVKNLTIESAALRVASNEEHTRNIGSIAGVNHGTIANCTSNAVVRCYASSTDGGGIAGENRGAIVECGFMGKVLTSQDAEGGDAYDNVVIGGVVGDNETGGVLMKCSSQDIEITHSSCVLYGQNQGTVLRENEDGVTVEGRTLYKDGSWNTLCLPFNVTIGSSVLAGATVMELDVSTEGYVHPTGIEGTVLYLNFREVDEVVAGRPYLIKWMEGDELVNPSFANVTIQTTSPAGITSKDGNVSFLGSFSSKKVGAQGDNTLLYLGMGNTLYYPATSMSIGALRAYFQLNNNYVAAEPEEEEDGKEVEGADVGGAAPRIFINDFRLNFGDEATAIHRMDAARFSRTDHYYDLSGRRVAADHVATGFYIGDGKKVFIRK